MKKILSEVHIICMIFPHRKYCDLVYSVCFPQKETCGTSGHQEKVVGDVLICLWSVYFQQRTDNSVGINLQKHRITNLKYKLRGMRTIFTPQKILQIASRWNANKCDLYLKSQHQQDGVACLLVRRSCFIHSHLCMVTVVNGGTALLSFFFSQPARNTGKCPQNFSANVIWAVAHPISRTVSFHELFMKPDASLLTMECTLLFFFVLLATLLSQLNVETLLKTVFFFQAILVTALKRLVTGKKRLIPCHLSSFSFLNKLLKTDDNSYQQVLSSITASVIRPLFNVLLHSIFTHNASPSQLCDHIAVPVCYEQSNRIP